MPSELKAVRRMRANRTHPELSDDHGWTYNHAPDLCYWNGRFYQEYLSNPVDEHIAPGQTLIITSADGQKLGKTCCCFSSLQSSGRYKDSGRLYRIYDASENGILYCTKWKITWYLAFYGHAEDPFLEGGIGRVVREAYKDGTLWSDLFYPLQQSHKME